MTEPLAKLGKSRARARQALHAAGLRAPLFHVRRWLRNPRNAAALDLDHWHHEFRYGSTLRAVPIPEVAGETALFLSFASYPAQVRAEAYLGKLLQTRGIQPLFATNLEASWLSRRLYKTYGHDQIVTVEPYVGRHPAQSQLAGAQHAIDQHHTFGAIKTIQYRGVNVGRHALSHMTRSLYVGDFDPEGSRYRGLLISTLAQAMANVHVAEDLLADLDPSIVLAHHPGNMMEGQIYETAIVQARNTLFWDSAQKKDHWIMKRYNLSNRDRQPFSLGDDTWHAARAMDWTPAHERALMDEIEGRYATQSSSDDRQLQAGKFQMTPREVQRVVGLDNNRPTAIVFAHITWDSSFFYGEDLFDGYEQWLVETTRAAAQNAEANWIIKLHPANRYKWAAEGKQAETPSDLQAIRDHLGPDLPDHVHIMPSDTPVNTRSLFAVMDACVTVRGTIGMEASCFGIPVVTAGTGRYSGRGFTLDSESRKAYLERLTNIVDVAPLAAEQVLLAKRHAFWLLLMRPVRFRTIRRVTRDIERFSGHPLVSNFQPVLRDPADILNDEAAMAWVEWAATGETEDFHRGCLAGRDTAGPAAA